MSKVKKTKKKLRLYCNFHQSTSPVNGCVIIPSTETDGGERTLGKKFYGVVSLLIADCVN